MKLKIPLTIYPMSAFDDLLHAFEDDFVESAPHPMVAAEVHDIPRDELPPIVVPQTLVDIDARITAPFTDNKITQYEQDAAILNEIVPIDRFSAIRPTTFGLNGFISHVSFIEERFIEYVRKTIAYPCVRIICNYGIAYSANYEQLIADGRISLVSEQKAARARAKKLERRVKPRKIQGSGRCFNSSMLVWLFSEQFETVYKILLFRTGNFNLSGMLPHRIRNAIHLINTALIPVLTEAFRAQNSDYQQDDPRIEYLTPIMKDYKWSRILDEQQTLNLGAIYAQLGLSVLPADMSGIFAIGHTYHEMCESKLSIKFNIIARPDKHVRVKIFAGGRINILGACDTRVTKKICEFVVSLITDDMIIREGSTAPAPVSYFDDDIENNDAAPSARAVPHIALFY